MGRGSRSEYKLAELARKDVHLTKYLTGWLEIDIEKKCA